MNKPYDRAYFDRWYRDPQSRVKGASALERRVQLAVAVAEYHLGHLISSVLDVGCGEGVWRAPLLALRPDLHYLGVDSSEYAIERYGRQRNLRLLPIERVDELELEQPVDLLVCSDVLHYVPTPLLKRGVKAFGELCDGVAFMDLFVKGDRFIGDRDGFVPRTAAWYRRTFASAGWTACGSHCYLGPRLLAEASSLELSAEAGMRKWLLGG